MQTNRDLLEQSFVGLDPDANFVSVAGSRTCVPLIHENYILKK